MSKKSAANRKHRWRGRELYGKEISLLFLSLFYFLIATNTQTGWLFVLSAFLLGLLCAAWLLTRKTVEALTVEIPWTNEPVKGSPSRFLIKLRNNGNRALSEVRVESDAPPWSSQSAPSVHTVTSLSPDENVIMTLLWTPTVRGEHKLPPVKVKCGAPFGLFTRTRLFQSEESFLVYPTLHRLPSRGWAALVTTALSEAVSTKGVGDSATLKGVRDYRPGDDLRHIHWKASAKRGPHSPLMVREHLAPAPTSSIFLLDTSCSVDSDEAFESAVSLAASLLWSAHKEGTSSKLWLLENGSWTCRRHWTEQYVALAKVTRDKALSYQDWLNLSQTCPWMESGRRGTSPILVKGAETDFESWPEWANLAYLALREEGQSLSYPSGIGVIAVPPALDRHA